ncbi:MULTISPECIES: hypothetical protein [Streptomyces]|uniref:hypothetical protein n=1 Tax=Streptomyces TaxID=1883 RepID=UPI002FC86E49
MCGIQDQIIQSIAYRKASLPVERIRSFSSLAGDLGLGPSEAPDLFRELEGCFDVDIPQAAAGELKTVRNVIDYIAARQ